MIVDCFKKYFRNPFQRAAREVKTHASGFIQRYTDAVLARTIATGVNRAGDYSSEPVASVQLNQSVVKITP